MRKVGRLSTVVLLFAALTTGPALAGEYVLFYHNDALGSPVAVTDINGNVVWRADYEPFGNVATLTETLPNTHQFLGKEVDAETSLHYLEARFYDGSIGRFLSVDPVLLRGRPALALKLSQRLNLYVYTTNNPYRYVDPSGLYLEGDSGAIAAGDAGTLVAQRSPGGGPTTPVRPTSPPSPVRTTPEAPTADAVGRGPRNLLEQLLGPREFKVENNIGAEEDRLKQLVPYGRSVTVHIYVEEATGRVVGSRFEGQDTPTGPQTLREPPLGPIKDEVRIIRGTGPEVKPGPPSMGPAR